MKNALLIFNEDLVVQRQVLCGEKCILYSAFISYDNVNELVIFSGTVFSEILIWKVSQNEERDSSVVLAKLKGHNVCRFLGFLVLVRRSVLSRELYFRSTITQASGTSVRLRMTDLRFYGQLKVNVSTRS